MWNSFKSEKNMSYQGHLDDSYISFNIKRLVHNYLNVPRYVALFRYHPKKLTIIPGIHKKRETRLYNELTASQNKRELEKFSFDYASRIFSFLWRFCSKINHLSEKNIYYLKPLDPHTSKTVLKNYKNYLDSLNSSLTPGNIYLIPDTEILFQHFDRYKQPYARRVLIIDVKKEQLWIVPFSSRTDKINKSRDIIFDPNAENSELNTTARPAIDNFPYTKMTKRSVLCLQAAQPFTRDNFFASALTCIGGLRKETLSIVRERLKN